MSENLPMPASAAIGLIFLVTPSAVLVGMGRRVDRLTSKALSIGKAVAPLVPRGPLLRIDERMIAANALCLLASAPFLLFVCVGQFFLDALTTAWMGIGAVLGALLAWVPGYIQARRVFGETDAFRSDG